MEEDKELTAERKEEGAKCGVVPNGYNQSDASSGND